MIDNTDRIGSAYGDLVDRFESKQGVVSGQMFGKPCLTIHGKAFAARHKDTIAFKLSGADHEKAIALSDAVLWDPSGKGRPMKEWVALTMAHAQRFDAFADAALAYVGGAG